MQHPEDRSKGRITRLLQHEKCSRGHMEVLLATLKGKEQGVVEATSACYVLAICLVLMYCVCMYAHFDIYEYLGTIYYVDITGLEPYECDSDEKEGEQG